MRCGTLFYGMSRAGRVCKDVESLMAMSSLQHCRGLMGWMRALLLCFLAPLGVMALSSNSTQTRPSIVNIGALYTLDSVIGRVTRVAIQAAVDDVNADPNVLSKTKLNVVLHDTNCSGFLGTMEALELIEKDVIAIIGSQSSGIAHTISHVAKELRVPLLSFAATDPTLSALQYSYFLRMIHSDYFQMKTIADFVDYFESREVIAIFVDDDYGRGGVSTLGDLLAEKRAKISYKAAFPLGATQDEIDDLLVHVNLMESRVYIVHVNPDTGLEVFAAAQRIGMVGIQYAWIAIAWLSSVLDLAEPVHPDPLTLVQGVVSFRYHTPDTEQKRKFNSQWSTLAKTGNSSSSLNAYGLYAYDTVWLIAHAVNDFLNEGGAISFVSDPRLKDSNDSSLHFQLFMILLVGRLFFRSC